MTGILRSFVFALRGIKACSLKEKNFRVQLLAALITIALAICIGISKIEWLIILLCVAVVLSLEMLNSAIEKLCDVVSAEYNEGIKLVKDISAGAVLVSAGTAAVCGSIIFIPKIISLIQSTS